MIIQLGFKRVYLAIVEIPKEDPIKQKGVHDNTVRIQKSIFCDSENPKGRCSKTNRLS